MIGCHTALVCSDYCNYATAVDAIALHTVAAKPERQARKASHCGSKQQRRLHAAITQLLLIHATYILFFAHIPFVVNRTFNATPTERLQQSQRVSKNLNMTVGRTACPLLCRYTQSTLAVSCLLLNRTNYYV